MVEIHIKPAWLDTSQENTNTSQFVANAIGNKPFFTYQLTHRITIHPSFGALLQHNDLCVVTTQLSVRIRLRKLQPFLGYEDNNENW